MTDDAAPAAARLHEVAPGVFAWIQPDGSWFINNAGAATGAAGTIVIDTCATEERTRRFLDALVGATGGAPVRMAANTHHHGDHTYGNSLLPDATVLFGHPRMREQLLEDVMIDSGRGVPIWDPVPQWGNVTKRVPDATVASDVTLFTGDRRVELRHPGFTAHTTGDLVAWLPDERVLFSGDLVFHRVTPMLAMGDVEGALRSVEWLASFGAETIVPGHGPLVRGAEVDDVLATHERYYRFVLELAAAGRCDGLDPLTVARRADLGDFAGWGDPERLVLNLHRAYADAAGEPYDLLAAFGDAMAWHGGPLPIRVCCTSP